MPDLAASTYRRNGSFQKEVTVSSGSAPVWQSVQTVARIANRLNFGSRNYANYPLRRRAV